MLATIALSRRFVLPLAFFHSVVLASVLVLCVRAICIFPPLVRILVLVATRVVDLGNVHVLFPVTAPVLFLVLARSLSMALFQVVGRVLVLDSRPRRAAAPVYLSLRLYLTESNFVSFPQCPFIVLRIPRFYYPVSLRPIFLFAACLVFF